MQMSLPARVKSVQNRHVPRGVRRWKVSHSVHKISPSGNEMGISVQKLRNQSNRIKAPLQGPHHAILQSLAKRSQRPTPHPVKVLNQLSQLSLQVSCF